MRTPAGKECRYYYQDFHRGRNIQECRLIRDNPDSAHWTPADCAKCPVPDILNANASPNMEMKLTVKSTLLGLRRQLAVSATCTKHNIPIDDLFIGCAKCNAERPGLDVFWQAINSGDDQ